MHLQSILHLRPRQRHDGHHEITNRFTKDSPSHSARRSLILTLPATAVLATILAPQSGSADPKPVGVWGWTSGSATYVRIRPGAQTPVVAKVSRSTQLMVWGTFNGWYRVETVDHKFGWIYHDYVRVPKAEKLHELSHFKAKKASDRAGHQTLYGRPELLKKYFTHYKAPGAAVGLQKQGISLFAQSSPTKKAVKVATKKPTKSIVARHPMPGRSNGGVTPRTVSYVSQPKANPAGDSAVLTGSATEGTNTSTPAPRPVVIVPRQTAPRAAKPVVKKTAPRKTWVSKTSARKPAAKPVVEKPNTPEVAPMSPAELPRITAEDILAARAEHLRNQLAYRHKTQPFVAPKANTDTTATVQPSSWETSPTPVKNATTSSATPISGTYSRGGSPRDVARWAKANNKFGDGVAKQALTYRGMPYIRGASSPNRGFDCSGLVYYLLRTRGYNPPRTAAGLASYGHSVSKDSLKPGDILLFANTYKRGVSHVGVYIGNGKFVHAANSHSGVKTDSLNSSYYGRKYYGARRVK